MCSSRWYKSRLNRCVQPITCSPPPVWCLSWPAAASDRPTAWRIRLHGPKLQREFSHRSQHLLLCKQHCMQSWLALNVFIRTYCDRQKRICSQVCYCHWVSVTPDERWLSGIHWTKTRCYDEFSILMMLLLLSQFWEDSTSEKHKFFSKHNAGHSTDRRLQIRFKTFSPLLTQTTQLNRREHKSERKLKTKPLRVIVPLRKSWIKTSDSHLTRYYSSTSALQSALCN